MSPDLINKFPISQRDIAGVTCLYVGRDPTHLAPVKIMAECQHRTEGCQGQRYFGDHMTQCFF